MRVIIDTNIFFRDFTLDNPAFRTLLSGLKLANHSLFVPRIVFEEVVNKYDEETKKLFKDAGKLGVKKLSSPFSRDVFFTSAEEVKEKYKEFLNQKLKSVDTQILDYPTISHENLVKRALDRRKPFRGTDTGGYRDALIWETVLEMAYRDPKENIALVSSNHIEFADDQNKEMLHPHLRSDIQELGEKGSEVYLFKDLETFVEKYIKPVLESPEGIRSQLQDGTYPKLNLRRLLEENIPLSFDRAEFDPRDLGFPWEFENPSIGLVDEVYDIKNIDVRKLPTDELLISFSAEVECEFDFFLSKENFYTLGDDIMPLVWDKDWNKHYMAASASAHVELEIRLTFNVAEGQVTSAQITGISPKEEWWERKNRVANNGD